MKGFASDNYSGVDPKILEALTDANQEHEGAYGDDRHTKKAVKQFQKMFGKETDIYFVYNGTGANVMSLKTLTKSYSSIICADTSHIYVDESTAPETFTGCRLKALKSTNGKISASQIEKHCIRFDDEHHAQPSVISITQPTELGTVYTVEEIKSISAVARKHNMFLHMDGARISNAAVSLNLDFKEFTKDAGVDVVSFGGTKNGLMFGEAVIFFDKNISKDVKYIRKHSMQLASKMRYIAAQFSIYLEDEIWKKNASHSNRMASLLHSKIKNSAKIEITQPVQANGIFAILPKDSITKLQDEYPFYVWDENTFEVRWMMSFDTTEKEVTQFASLLEKI